MRKKRKKKIKVFCRYCYYFWYSSDRKAEEIIKNRIIVKDNRWCNVVNNYVSVANEACENFKLSKYFWCEKDCNQLNVSVCLARRMKRKDGCVRCKQGKIIETIIKETNRETH